MNFEARLKIPFDKEGIPSICFESNAIGDDGQFSEVFMTCCVALRLLTNVASWRPEIAKKIAHEYIVFGRIGDLVGASGQDPDLPALTAVLNQFQVNEVVTASVTVGFEALLTFTEPFCALRN